MKRTSTLAPLVFLLGLWLGGSAPAADPSVATIRISSAPAGGGGLVQGVMTFRGQEYVVELRGLTAPANTHGVVEGVKQPRDVEGRYHASERGLTNESGVTLRVTPPLSVGEKGLEIEVTGGVQPKISRGHRETGVD
jgi:hypothetical protein